MSALSTADLDAMRADIADLLPDSCIISTLGQTADGQGGFTEAWTPAGTVACRIDNMSGGKSNVGASQQPFSGWVLSVPYDTDLTEANQVQVNGETYNVLAVDYDKSWPVVLRASVGRVA